MLEGKEYRSIEIDKIEPNSWNINKMDDEEFNRLSKEIQEVGFITPIEVVQIDGDTEKYRIIGGEHRWSVAKVLGFKEIDCTVLTDKKWKDEDLQKFVSIRLNIIKGKIDPERFIVLYEEMEKKYGSDSLKDLMGFTDDSAWGKLTSGIKDALKGSGLPEAVIDRFDEEIKELKTIDGLSSILNKIFNEHGDTIKYNFLSFSFGSKEGLFVMCEDGNVYNAAKEIVEAAKVKSVKADTAIGKFIKNWKEKGIDDIKPDVEEKKAEATGAVY